jgi:hypothetical protein
LSALTAFPADEGSVRISGLFLDYAPLFSLLLDTVKMSF